MSRRLLVVVLAVAVAGPALAAQASWDRQLGEMGYMFLHISNINVVNGLNLTREQAKKLYGLARQIEAVAPRPPSFKARLAPELESVRKDWLELRRLLAHNKPVPEELQSRVNQSRAAESAVIRKTIRPRPISSGTKCSACHTAPSEGSGEPMTVSATLKRQVDMAHSEGLYGKRGLAKLVLLAPQIDTILTDGQKGILGSFACCLVPPQDLSDPMRAGQAESSEKVLTLMRKVRQCPDRFWPIMRNGILTKVDQITAAVSPGATVARKTATREKIAKALDRIRQLSDVEFEMEKAELAKSVKAAIIPPQKDSRYKAAYFLLIPGASKVYANYIRRLDKKGKASAGR